MQRMLEIVLNLFHSTENVNTINPGRFDNQITYLYFDRKMFSETDINMDNSRKQPGIHLVLPWQINHYQNLKIYSLFVRNVVQSNMIRLSFVDQYVNSLSCPSDRR